MTTNNRVVELSIVIPIYNEELIIDELYKQLSDSVSKITTDYELIFVNDGSRDDSFSKLRQLASTDENQPTSIYQ